MDRKTLKGNRRNQERVSSDRSRIREEGGRTPGARSKSKSIDLVAILNVMQEEKDMNNIEGGGGVDDVNVELERNWLLYKKE